MNIQGAMFFSPNLTGPLHIASAIVLWLTAREAKLRGLRVVVTFDKLASSIDHPGMYHRYPSMQQRLSTEQSTVNACELLGIEDVEYRWRAEYQARYTEVFEIMKEMHLVVEIQPTMYVGANTPHAFDHAKGSIYDENDLIATNYTFGRSFMALVDWWDYKTPMHVRGQDILYACHPEWRLWPTMCATLGEKEPMEYVHIPHIYRADKTPLHRSAGDHVRSRIGLEGDPYAFENWAQQFKDAESRQRMLERIITAPKFRNQPFSLNNIFCRRKTALYYGPVTHHVEYFQGNSAQRRASKRREKCLN